MSQPPASTKSRKRKHHEVLSNDTEGDNDEAIERLHLQEQPSIPTIASDWQYSTSEPVVTILLGSEIQRIPQSKFVCHVWRHGLDSECMVCHKDFSNGDDPPIRTLRFDTSHTLESSSLDITQAPITQNAVRVFNRHFSCLKKAKIEYIPISHAWHQSVSSSQQSHSIDIATTRLVYQTPVKTLLGLAKSYANVEIWHDYLSVPQWHENVQRQLLLAIPQIYAFPERMLIHLDDVKTQDFERVKKKTGYRAFIEGISNVTKSRWFDRVWVTLEYIQGREVLMLSEDFEILDINAASLCEKAESNIAKYTKQYGQDKYSDDALARGHRWPRTMSWIDMETWKNKDAKYRTFGGAIYILGQKECRDAHDYYFAIRGLLGLGQNRDQTANIISGDSFQSYRAIAWQALERGDYTPLLLTPPKDEQKDHRAPWLSGHSHLTENLWDLGMCHQKAGSQIIIRYGKIRPELEAVGLIEEFQYYDFKADSSELVFQYVVEKISAASGVKPEAFCEAIERIFPDNEKKACYSHWNMEEHQSMPDSNTVVPEYSRVGQLLREVVRSTQSRSGALEALRGLIEVLGLGKLQSTTNISRIDEASKEAEWYQHPHRGYQEMEGLGRIACKFCGTRSLYRLSIWDASNIKLALVYRIPGLLYDLTLPNGTGIVVCQKRIVGKMAYGKPSCDCHEMEIVDLGE